MLMYCEIVIFCGALIYMDFAVKLNHKLKWQQKNMILLYMNKNIEINKY